MKAKIEEIAYNFGSQEENLDKLKSINPDWDVKKIHETTGINKRFCSSDSETALDLAIKSAKKIKI